MRPNIRSVTGMLLFVGMLPIFASLLACIPEYVPLGNPDRARIDKEFNGIWFIPHANELMGHLVMLRPWDKHTWLITNVMLEPEADVELGDHDMTSYEDFVELLETPGINEDSFNIDVLVYKGWLARVGGERFFVWELRGVPRDETDPVGPEPMIMYDFLVADAHAQRIELRLIDTEFEPLKAADKTRRAWERVIRKHVDDPSLYDEDAVVLQRIPDEDIGKVGELFFAAFIDE